MKKQSMIILGIMMGLSSPAIGMEESASEESKPQLVPAAYIIHSDKECLLTPVFSIQRSNGFLVPVKTLATIPARKCRWQHPTEDELKSIAEEEPTSWEPQAWVSQLDRLGEVIKKEKYNGEVVHALKKNEITLHWYYSTDPYLDRNHDNTKQVELLIKKGHVLVEKFVTRDDVDREKLRLVYGHNAIRRSVENNKIIMVDKSMLPIAFWSVDTCKYHEWQDLGNEMDLNRILLEDCGELYQKEAPRYKKYSFVAAGAIVGIALAYKVYKKIWS